MTKQKAESAPVEAIEITPEMVEAGLSELNENFRLVDDWRNLVTSIYIPMSLTSPQQLLRANAAI